jgi:serine/threonine-protein kinase
MDAGNPSKSQEHFGPYRVVRQIGSGGMASIYEALDTHLGHRVAIKRLHPHIAARAGASERFLGEGRAAARIRHPHVVQVFALGSEGAPSPYLAMELLEGRDLGDLLASEGRLGVVEALSILLPVIAGVGAAHDAGVVHRDLKPSNVFISAGSRGRPWPKVLDFGVSKVLEQDGGNPSTATDGVIGTAAYMAPEQARAARNASFRSDQYSLAVMLYQCLTGQLPFVTSGVYDLLVAIMTAPLAPPGQHAPGIPPELDAVVMRAMGRDPDDRFPSVRAFGAALLPFASERERLAWEGELHEHADAPAPASRVAPAAFGPDTPPTMSPTARDTRASSRWRQRHLGRFLTLGAWVALIGAGGTVAMMREPHPSASASPPSPDPSAGTPGAAAPVASMGAPSVDAPAPAAPAPSAATPTAVPQAVVPPRSHPADPRRPAPVTTASAIPSASHPPPVPSTTATPAIGNNGAPILP